MKNIFRIALCLALTLSLISGLSACGKEGTLTAETLNLHNEIKAGSETVYYGEVSRPKIKISGRKDVQKSINSALDELAAQILEPVYDYRAEYLDITSQGGEYFSAADYSLSVYISRQTDELLFMRSEAYLHEACAASDIEVSSGLCFSLVTGEEIGLAQLTEDPEGLYAALMKELKRTARLEGVKDVDLDYAQELLSDGTAHWYVDENGLTVSYTAGDIAPRVYGNLYASLSDEKLAEAGIFLS